MSTTGYSKKGTRRKGRATRPNRRAAKVNPTLEPGGYISLNPDTYTTPAINAADQDLRRQSANAMAALVASNNPPSIVVFRGRTCRLEPKVPERPVPMDVHMMRYALARAADWIVKNKSGSRPARPPLDVARDLLAWPDPPLPRVDEIVSVPVFAASGALLASPGFHESDRVLHIPTPGLRISPVSDHPSRAELERAKTVLLEDLLGDFPFTGESERVHAISALIQPFVRRMIQGPCPFFLIEKPIEGTGGTLLAQVVVFPHLGDFPPAMTPPTDEGEWRRTLYASLAGESDVIFIDNIDGPLVSPTLASALTTPSFTDRVVRSSSTLPVSVRALFIGSGNNPRLSRELLRRAIRIRIDPGVEKPEQRTGFRHPDLRGYVRQARGELVWAILTIVQAWIDVGRPRGQKTLGGYESWSWTLGGVLEVAGLSGFLGNRDEFSHASADDESGLRQFVELWFQAHQRRAVGVRDLLDLAWSLDLGDGGEQALRIKLGRYLQGHRDRACGPYIIRHAGAQAGSRLYRLEVKNP